MKKFIIITDSCCDLTIKQIDEMGIRVIPLSFTMKGITYRNDPRVEEVSYPVFYDRMRNKEISTTSQATPKDYYDTFEKYVSEGYDILSISFSSALSGTYSSSRIAANMVLENHPDAKIICVDSLCASFGQGMLVYNAAKRQKEGMSIEEVALWTEDYKNKLAHWFTVDDLGTLRRGGRLSATSAFVGSLLGIKPVLHVSFDGKLVPVYKARGRKNSMKIILDELKKSIIHPEEQVIFISHADCEADAKQLGEMIKNEVPVRGIEYAYIGPVIGSHCGPGTIALFFFATTR